MSVAEITGRPVVSLEEFARAVADSSPLANELGRRAAAYLDTLAHPVRPGSNAENGRAAVPIDLGPSIRAAARDRVFAALLAAVEAATPAPRQRELISDPTHELRTPDPHRPQ